jgi:GNAT superfamily N-acetyltransferase
MLSLIHSHAAYEGGEASVSLDALRSALDLKPAPLVAWVAVQAGELIGYATATIEFSTWAGRPFLYLDCLFVEESHRSRGIGAALLNAVRVHAAAFGISEIQWQTPDWNENAVRFYLREGASMSRKARFTLLTM